MQSLVKRSLQIPRFAAVTGDDSAFDVEVDNDRQIRELFNSRRFLQLNEIYSSLLLGKELELEDLAAAQEWVAKAALLCGETQTAREIWQQMAADDPGTSTIPTRLGFTWLVEAEHTALGPSSKKPSSKTRTILKLVPLWRSASWKKAMRLGLSASARGLWKHKRFPRVSRSLPNGCGIFPSVRWKRHRPDHYRFAHCFYGLKGKVVTCWISKWQSRHRPPGSTCGSSSQPTIA